METQEREDCWTDERETRERDTDLRDERERLRRERLKRLERETRGEWWPSTSLQAVTPVFPTRETRERDTNTLKRRDRETQIPLRDERERLARERRKRRERETRETRERHTNPHLLANWIGKKDFPKGTFDLKRA